MLLSFPRFPMPTRPPSVHSTASSTDSEDCDENYVAMVSNMPADEPVCNTTLPHCQHKSHDSFTSLQSQTISESCTTKQTKFGFLILGFLFPNGSASLSAIEIKSLFCSKVTVFSCSCCSLNPRRPLQSAEKPSSQQGASSVKSIQTYECTSRLLNIPSATLSNCSALPRLHPGVNWNQMERPRHVRALGPSSPSAQKSVSCSSSWKR